jgi:hypothetical protein
MKVTIGMQADLVRALIQEAQVRATTAVEPQDWDSIAASLDRAARAARHCSAELIERDPPADK